MYKKLSNYHHDKEPVFIFFYIYLFMIPYLSLILQEQIMVSLCLEYRARTAFTSEQSEQFLHSGNRFLFCMLCRKLNTVYMRSNLIMKANRPIDCYASEQQTILNSTTKQAKSKSISIQTRLIISYCYIRVRATFQRTIIEKNNDSMHQWYYQLTLSTPSDNFQLYHWRKK